MTEDLARYIVRPLLARHPLPWKTEMDWSIEVIDSNGALVMSFPPQGVGAKCAKELIDIATRLAAYDADGSREYAAFLAEHGIDDQG